MTEGDIVAFYSDGKIVCWGRIFAKVHSVLLAEKLWRRGRKGETWEYVYFIRDLRRVNIPWDIVRAELGYEQGFVPQGHMIVAKDRVQAVVERYGSIEEFLRVLELRSRASVEGEDSGSMKRGRFRAEEPPQLPRATQVVREAAKMDDCDRGTLYLYGKVLLLLAGLQDSEVSKKTLEKVIGSVLVMLLVSIPALRPYYIVIFVGFVF